jgi:hypothetical protein
MLRKRKKEGTPLAGLGLQPNLAAMPLPDPVAGCVDLRTAPARATIRLLVYRPQEQLSCGIYRVCGPVEKSGSRRPPLNCPN